MGRLFQLLPLNLLAGSGNEAAKIIQFQAEELRILRRRVKQRVIVTPQERRRLVKLGWELGPAIKDLITIVTARTFARWVSGTRGGKSTDPGHAPRKVGRPRTREEI